MDRKIIKGKVTGDRSKKLRKASTADITTGMVKVIVICWLVPFLALSVVLFYYSSINSAKKTKQTIQTSMGNVGLLCKDTIEGIIKESKQASYDGVISQSYSDYLSDIKNGNEEKGATDKLRVRVNKYLGERYKYNKKIAATFVLFTDGRIEQCYTISNMAGATYSSVVSKYVKYGVKDKVLEEAENLGTGVKMVVIGNEMYLIRNIVDKDFVPYAVIMMELNGEKVFEGLNNVVWKNETFAIVDEELIGVHKGKEPDKINSVKEYCKDTISDDRFREKNVVLSTYDNEEKWGLVSFNEDNNQYSFVVIFDKNAMENDGKIAIYLYIIILLLLVPLMIATVAYFYKNVSNPIAKLMYASEKIEKGKYGYQIEEFDTNQEFSRLIEVFNEMSSSLKNSFDRLYAEEVAVRDANMQALQAQINPHFLNNTLEIINWKARIAGNDDVSGMIESRGVMMEAT
ncbi:MAG: histidine kinase, partial [Lachnospiraceae bacterium]|nr:histidine kinase [Lachnospiraceae bacterium]